MGMKPFVRTVGQPTDVWGALLTTNTPLPTNSWWENLVLGHAHADPVRSLRPPTIDAARCLRCTRERVCFAY